MDSIMVQIIVSVIAGLVLAYAVYRFGIRRFRFERKISQKDQEINRNKGMLLHLEGINTAANIPRERYAGELLRNARKWFDENCLLYRNTEPYKEFEFLLKWVSAYTRDPDVFAKEAGSKCSSFEMFERITNLQEKLTNMPTDMTS